MQHHTTNTWYPFNDLNAGEKYLLEVSAFNSNGESEYNGIRPVTLAPATTNLSMDIEYITKLTPEGNHYKELGDSQDRKNVYSVKATINNTGNADANSVLVSLSENSHTMNIIPKDYNLKRIDIPKNGSKTVYWELNLSTSL